MQGNEPLFPSDPELEAALDADSDEVQEVPPASLNRPAKGARQVSPGDILGQAFEGNEGATDFLGLDVDFSADEQQPEPSPAPADDSPSTAADLDPLTLDLALPTGDAPPAPLATGGPVSIDMEAPIGSAVEPLEDSIYPDESELLAPEGDYELEYEEEEFEEEPQAAGARRYALLAAAGFAVGLVVVVGAVTLRGKLAPAEPTPGPVEVAGTGTEVAPVVADTTPRPVATEPQRITRTGAAREPRAGNLLPSLPSGTVSEPLIADAAGPSDPGVESFVQGSAGDPSGVAPGDGTAGPLYFPGQPVETIDPELMNSEREHRTATLSFPELLGSATEGTSALGVSPEDMDFIWRSTDVPSAAIGGSVKLLTPAVGSVRVQMRSGELFDGRLVAVGLNSVWIDSDIGRIGLAGDRVESIERLIAPTATDAGLEEVVMGERVRVESLGGVIYGRVLKKSGDKVTLATEDGGRITLTNPKLATLGEGRSVVLRE